MLARLGVNRSGHRVDPGLYTIGTVTEDAPVFVSANYTLSFDALRSALNGINSYILVLDTKGINVWCAAGKRTFGTEELINRIESTRLRDVVRHRKIILPQLGAPGISAHEVKKRSGFNVDYGPVRAADVPAYLEAGHATKEMRAVRFGLWDRVVLIPVEFRLPVLLIFTGLLLVAFNNNASFTDAGWLAAFLAGLVLFPLLIPWIPTRDFSSKGFILGGLVSLPFIAALFWGDGGSSPWRPYVEAATLLLAWTPITAFLALNFTGSSTYTSRTGVRREMFRYLPIMAGMFVIGLLGYIVLLFI